MYVLWIPACVIRPTNNSVNSVGQAVRSGPDRTPSVTVWIRIGVLTDEDGPKGQRKQCEDLTL